MTDRKQPTAIEAPSSRPVKGRRRFLGAGVGATPALIALASQPALGATCFTPSRSLSKNTSITQQDFIGECTGISPGNYKTQTTPGTPSYHWPDLPQPNTPFHPLFAGSRFMVRLKAGGVRSLTLLEVLDLPNCPADLRNCPSDRNKVAFHIIGAYLNVQNKFVPELVLDSAKVKIIWAEFTQKGYFEPTAGVRWGGTAIVAYLSSNAIAP